MTFKYPQKDKCKRRHLLQHILLECCTSSTNQQHNHNISAKPTCKQEVDDKQYLYTSIKYTILYVRQLPE